MTSANLNILIEAGTDFQKSFRMQCRTGIIDLSEWIFASQMRAVPGGEVVADFDFSLNSDNTIVAFSLDHETTAQITPGRYSWDLFAEQPSGKRIKIFEGKATVTSRITVYV